MQLHTKQNTEFCKEPKGIILEDYTLVQGMGVTKIAYFNTPVPKWLEEWRDKVGKIGQKEVQDRGHKIHEELEENAEILQKILPDCKLLGNEIFVYGNLFGLDALGFIDALFMQKNGDLLIVDYKTKDATKLKKSLAITLEQKFQLYTYKTLFCKTYPLLAKNKINLKLIYIAKHKGQYNRLLDYK